MAKRVAVLMKLRDGVTRGEVKELCDLLRRIGDPQWLTTWSKGPGLSTTQKTDEEIVNRYDDKWGDPTFYVP